MSKPKPAPIPEKNGYRLHLCINGKQYKRKLIRNLRVANVFQSRINSLVVEYKTGLLVIPSSQPPHKFIFDKVLSITDSSINEKDIFFLPDLISKYIAYCSPPVKSVSTCKTEKIHLRRLQEFIDTQSDVLLSEVNVGFFNDYKKFRYEKSIKTDTVKKELTTFQTMFQFALDNGYVTKNIVKSVKRDKSQVPSDRFRTIGEVQELVGRGIYQEQELLAIKRYVYLDTNEIRELLELTKNHWMHSIIVTFVFTGIRRGEMLNLQWCDVDLERKVLQVTSQKQSKKSETKRTIEIHPALLEILKEIKKTNASKLVFTKSDGERISPERLHEEFRSIIKGTKFEGIGFHAFRHSLASNLAAKGVDQRIIDSILGHQTEDMRKRYRHLFPNQQLDAISKIII